MDQNQTYGIPQAGKSAKVAYTGTHGATAAMPEACRTIRVIATTDCFIQIGTAPVAVADVDCYLPALTPEYFLCPANAKVSAIQVTTGGTIYVTPL